MTANHDPLPDQRRQGVDHLVLLSAVSKARRDPLDQPDRTIGVPQQQPTAIEVMAPASNAATTRRRPKPFKLELFGATLCWHRTPRSNLASD